MNGNSARPAARVVRGRQGDGPVRALPSSTRSSATGNVANGGTSATGGNGGAVFNSGAPDHPERLHTHRQLRAPSTASGAITGYGGGVFNGPVARRRRPDRERSSTRPSSRRTLPSGVTSHAFVRRRHRRGRQHLRRRHACPVPAILTLTRARFHGHQGRLHRRRAVRRRGGDGDRHDRHRSLGRVRRRRRRGSRR